MKASATEKYKWFYNNIAEKDAQLKQINQQLENANQKFDKLRIDYDQKLLLILDLEK